MIVYIHSELIEVEERRFHQTLSQKSIVVRSVTYSYFTMKLHLFSIAVIIGSFSSLAHGCEQNTVEYTWAKGQNSTLRIETPANVFKWKVEIEYDSAPIRLNP